MSHANARDAWYRGISTGGMPPLHYSMEGMVSYWMNVSCQCKRCMAPRYQHWRHASLALLHGGDGKLQNVRLMPMQEMHGTEVSAPEACLPCINSPSRWEIIECMSCVNERAAWHRCSGTGDNASLALIHRGDSKDCIHTCVGANEWVSEWLSFTAFLEQRTARSI